MVPTVPGIKSRIFPWPARPCWACHLLPCLPHITLLPWVLLAGHTGRQAGGALSQVCSCHLEGSQPSILSLKPRASGSPWLLQQGPPRLLPTQHQVGSPFTVKWTVTGYYLTQHSLGSPMRPGLLFCHFCYPKHTVLPGTQWTRMCFAKMKAWRNEWTELLSRRVFPQFY